MIFRPSYRSIWGISFPLILAGISETVVDITDTIFLARYGVTELAAVGIADAIYGIALFVSLGLVDGLQIIIGRRVGEGRKSEIGRVFNQGLYMLALVSAPLILFIVFIVPAATAPVFASADVHGAVNDYLQITAYALLFQSVNLAYSAFYIGISKTRILIGAAAVLAVSNIVLDYALIFGNFNLPELGIRGAAIASIAAEILAFAFISQDLLRKGYASEYGLLRPSRWSRRYAVKLAAISYPVSLEALVDTLKWFLFFLIIEQRGEIELASATIIYSCYALFLIPVDSFSETVCTMISNLIGQQQIPRLKLLITRTIKLTYMVVAPLLVVAVAFPELVLSIFTPDETIIGVSYASLVMVTVITVIAVPAYTHYAAVFGTGDTGAILRIQIIMTVSAVAIAYCCALVLGLALEYVWLAEMAACLICLGLSWYWFRSEQWKKLEI